jgi:BirA family biotin operon repressor/biotin-[acetyl-CoA-carboxylase] ligase
LTGREASIKWPNDAYLGGKKYSGVLTELSAELDRINFVILGIGINLNQSARDFPRALRKIATSVRIAAGKPVSRLGFLHKFLEEFERIYQEYQKTGLQEFKPEIMRRFYLLNKRVSVQIGDRKFGGKAVDIDPLGALVLEAKSGLKKVVSGDVTLA